MDDPRLHLHRSELLCIPYGLLQAACFFSGLCLPANYTGLKASNIRTLTREVFDKLSCAWLDWGGGMM